MSDHDPLRDELARAAQPPTDTAGVADTVLARIAATPPGGGGGGGAAGGGTAAWVAITGVAATVALVAGIGLGLRFGDDDPTVSTDEVGAVVVGGDGVDLHDCPDGSPVGTLTGGDRVLVVAQADDGAWVAVRRPTDLGARAWVPVEVVVPDGDLAGVPEDGCGDHGELALVAPDGVTQTSLLGPPPEAGEEEPGEEPEEPSGPEELAGPSTTTGPAPTVAPGPTPPGPTPPGPTPPGPQPTVPQPTVTTQPPDTTGPTIQNAAASPGVIYDTGCGPTSSTIAAYVTDPSGVTSVTASWKVGAKPRVTKPMGGGSTRTTTFTTGGAVPFSWNQQPVTVTVTATDSRGNQSTAQVVVRVTYCFA